MPSLLLILFTESLNVCFAVWIKQLFATLLPCSLHLRRCDIPVRTALFQNGTKVLAKIFHSGPAEEPVAVVDLINQKAWLEDNHVRDHGIVGGIRVFGDVEIFLNNASEIGEERPVGAHSAAIFIRLG